MDILLVDDDPQLLRIAALVLRRAGHRVTEMGDPRDVVAHCRARPPAALVLDVNMDAMDGTEVLARLRAELPSELIPVVFLTGHCDQESRERLIRLGAAGVIAKPILPARLPQQLQEILSGAAPG